jgi:hypothetical protein
MTATADPNVVAGTSPAGATPYTASNREVYSRTIGGIASHGLIRTFGLASTIFTIGFKLDPVVVGWAMMLPRVFDALLDPFLGHLVGRHAHALGDLD